MIRSAHSPQKRSRRLPKFRLGQVVATPGALEAFVKASDDPTVYLRRHQTGDWGDLDAEDKQANDHAVAHENDTERQGRVLSAYRLKDGTKIWIITERDRSATTILLPEEY